MEHCVSTNMSSLFNSPTAMSSLLAAARYQAQGLMMNSAFASMSGYASGGEYDASAYSFPVMDQVALTSITQAGLTDLFGSASNGKPIDAGQYASGILSSAGWDAGESSIFGSGGYGGLMDIYG